MVVATDIELNGNLTEEAIADEVAEEISADYVKPKVKFADRLRDAIAEGQDAFKKVFFAEANRFYRKTGLSREDFDLSIKDFLEALANGYTAKGRAPARSPQKMVADLTSKFASLSEDQIAEISKTLGDQDKQLLQKLLS